MKREHDAAKAALEALRKEGADVASAQAATLRRTEFNAEGGRFTLMRTTLDHTLSLTAIAENRKGTVSGNSFEGDAIAAAAAECVASARAAQADPAWELAGQGEGSFTDGAPEPDLDRFFGRTRELIDAVHAQYPKIILEQVVALHGAQEAVYLNTHGVNYALTSGSYQVQLMFSGHEGDKSSSFNSAGVSTDSLDTPFLELGSLRQNLADAENQIHTAQPEGKFEGTVIFTPDCLGGMLYELLSNYAADSVLLDGTSQWKDSLGKQVADPRLTISLSPRDPSVVCGERWTGEGFLSEDYDVIKDGVLNRFMLSAYAANKTGHGRAPNTSLHMVVQPGDTPLADIIANTKKGLLVARYSGGAASAGGEFSGVAKNSFLIEDGKVGPAVSETMISGNLAGMLGAVEGISRETVRDGSGSLPWLAVGGITISGK
ncbi:MAG TPA: metallopeptidase TldD-related protein [Candidatus Limnocylindria bacterium]|nr:metallopeptidase TldD-related protein [Candidatus Limnocylindria bacterium]